MKASLDARSRKPIALLVWSADHERALDEVVPRFTHARRHLKSASLEQLRQVREHHRASANHHSIGGRIERRHFRLLEQLAGFNQRGNAPLRSKALARNGWKV